MTQIAVTVANATAMSGIGKTKLYEEIRAGKLRTRKAGRLTLILVEDLETYVRALPFANSKKAA